MTPSALLGFHQTVMAICAQQFRVSEGVAEGQALSFSADLFLDDHYRLLPDTRREPLAIGYDSAGKMRLHPNTAHGTAGHLLVADSLLTLMSRLGQLIELLVLVEVHENMARGVYIVPLTPLRPMEPYRLLRIQRDLAQSTLNAQPVLIFAEGTRLIDAAGHLKAIEAFEPGEGVITAGGRASTIRARFEIPSDPAFCPPLLGVPRGIFENSAPLILSPLHRVHSWRPDQNGKRAHRLMPIADLVGREGIMMRPPVPQRFHQILLDSHRPVMIGPFGFDATFLDPANLPVTPPQELKTAQRH